MMRPTEPYGPQQMEGLGLGTRRRESLRDRITGCALEAASDRSMAVVRAVFLGRELPRSGSGEDALPLLCQGVIILRQGIMILATSPTGC